MRRSLYVVLMVVLVLRGLTGTAMAAGVLQPLQAIASPHAQEHSHCQTAAEAYDTSQGHWIDQATQAVDAPKHESGHTSAHHDDHAAHAAHAAHAEHAAKASSGNGPSAACAAHDHHAAACSACEICHSAMLDATSAPAAALRSLGTLLPAAAAQFDSAPAALAIKPPIA